MTVDLSGSGSYDPFYDACISITISYQHKASSPLMTCCTTDYSGNLMQLNGKCPVP